MSVIATLSQLKVKDVVSWSHYSTINPPNIVEAEIVGFIASNGLRAPETAAANHGNIYSSLPVVNGIVTPNDYTKYDYILLRKQIGVDVGPPATPIYAYYEIGIPWIVPASITRTNRESLILQIDDFDTNRLDAIVRILKNNGFLKYSYKIVGNT